MAEPEATGRDAAAGPRRFPCGQCGAKLAFTPGTSELACSYCGHVNPIPESDADVRELDYRTHLERAAEDHATESVELVRCGACGAELEPDPRLTAFSCPYCDSHLVTESRRERRLEPESLLPFGVARQDARQAFAAWLGGLWFAPGGLKRYATREGKLNGMYMPYWTYDADTTSRYTGQRGDHYWVTETYTATDANGNPQTRTRQVRRTRWSPASGVVRNRFDDVLVGASRSLPRKYVRALEPWDLENLVPYAGDYLSGFQAESYQIDVADGFDVARERMEPEIRAAVCRDIGGDEQVISSLDSQYDDVTFKHVLLPLWISSYRFRGKVYRFLVNARTGEVRGERPWSVWKIAAAALVVILVILVIVLVSQ